MSFKQISVSFFLFFFIRKEHSHCSSDICVVCAWNEGELPDLRSQPPRPGSSRFRVLPGIPVSNSSTASDSALTSLQSPSVIQTPAGTPADVKSAPSTNTPSSKTSHSDMNAAAKSKSLSFSSESSASRSGTTKQLLPDKPSSGQFVSRQQVPSAPKEAGEQILLAVKLPSGERLQRYFRSTDKLETVLRFAESESKSDFKGCEFVRADNREILPNMKKTVGECGIVDRSVLFLQLPEMP